jgi:hypothetical protein
MAEEVGAELQLEAVRGGVPGRYRHDAGVVDQQIDGTALPPQPKSTAQPPVDLGIR